MVERDWLATEFEQHRPLLRTIAYRMLGSVSESDDAVQEAWLRLNRVDGAVDNLGGWLGPWSGASVSTCSAPGRRGTRTTSARGFPSRSSRSTTRRTPSRRR